MNINNHFGEQLKKFVDEKNINVGKVAKKMGISHNGFTDYYKSSNPRPNTLKKILDGLDVKIEDIYGSNIANEEAEKYEVKNNLENMVVMSKDEYQALMKAKDRELEILKENNDLLRENNQLRSELMKQQTKKIDKLEEKVL